MSLFSKIRSGKIIFSLTLLSLLLSAITFPNITRAGSASLYVSPSSGTYKLGANITASIYVNSGGRAINAAQATVNYSPDYLQYQSSSTSSSIFSFWTTQPAGNSTSTSFGGGLATPGYTGGGGKILSITWKAKKEGSTSVTISNGLVLDNETNEDILGGSGGATFTIGSTPSAPKKPSTPVTSPPTLKSPSHPDQNTWYNKKTVVFTWSGGTGATGYGYSFDKVSGVDTSYPSYPSGTSKTYDNVSGGVWYFHLKGKTATGTLPVVQYKVQIDSTAPKEFTITIDQAGGLTNPKPKISFNAQDDTSGINRYEAKIGSGDNFTPKSGDTLPLQHPGHHTITIKAYDRAGNVRESTATFRVQGLNPPTVILEKHLVGLLDPVCFQGNSGKDDTVFVTLDDKSLDKFLVKDTLLKNTIKSSQLSAPANDQSTWRYCYQKLILPGNHVFRFSRINAQGAESEPTEPLKIKVEAATIKLYGYIIPMKFALFTSFGLLFILFLIILYLLRKIHKLAKGSKDKLISIARWIKSSARFSDKIESEIQSDIPNRDLNKKEVDEIKIKLKERIEQAEEEIDAEVQKKE